jgi:hypothetical protein
MNRRRFLRHAALMATGGLLAACAIPSTQSLAGEPIEPNPRPVQVPLPQAGDNGNVVPDAELEQFLALYALLTGVDDLNPAIGQLYYNSLQQNSTLEIPVNELLAQVAGSAAAMPASLEALASTGLFDNEVTRALADKITEYWYTGVYDTADGEQAVATFVEALAWQTLTFTKPMTVCGSFSFWTEAPESAID